MARVERTKDGFFRRLNDDTGKPSKYWSTRLNGKRVCTKQRDLEAARLWRREEERKAADPTYQASRATTLESAIETFLTDLKTAKRSEKTLTYYATKLGAALAFWGGDKPIANITPATVQDFVAFRTTPQELEGGAVSQPIEMSTARKEVAALVTLLNTMRHRGLYVTDPRTLKPPRLGGRYKPRKKYPTPAVFALIIKELERRNLHHRAAWLCACVATGGRLSEINRLRKLGIDFVRGLYVLDVTKTIETEGATRERPILPFAEPLLKYARRWGEGVGGLVLMPWEPSNLFRVLKSVCEAVGCEPYTANDFRRAHASWLAQLGVPNNLVAHMLGHTTTAMVDKVYAQMTPQAAKALIAQTGAGSFRTDSVPETPDDPQESPTSDDENAAEKADPTNIREEWDRLLIPLIEVRILASEPASESIEEPPSGPIPDVVADPSEDPLSPHAAGLVLKKGVAAALAGDRAGVAKAMSGAARIVGKLDHRNEERFLRAIGAKP